MRNDDHTSRKWQGRPGSRGVAHAAWGGAIEHENYSPPLEGCRVGLFPTGRPTPKADAFCPSLEGIFMGAFHAPSGGATKDENLIPPWKGAGGGPVANMALERRRTRPKRPP